MNLTSADYRKLEEESWILPGLADAAGLFRVDMVEGGRYMGRNGNEDYSGIIHPFIWPGESVPREYCLRLDHPPLEYRSDGSTKEKNKYIFPVGRTNLLYFPPGITPEMLGNPDLPAIISEGMKKIIALQRLALYGCDLPRFLPTGISGVWNWKGKIGIEPDSSGQRQTVKGPIPDLSRIIWAGRTVYILFDADKWGNPLTQAAERELAKELKSRGATVKIIDLPVKAGLMKPDDFLAHTDGGPERMLALIEAAREFEPDLLRYHNNDHGNCGRLVAIHGHELRYCHEMKKWIIWDGRRWAVDEVKRAFVFAKTAILEYLQKAIKAGIEAHEKFAKATLNTKEIKAMLTFAESELGVGSKELDIAPHRLNFANGTVDLRTGELFPHDPRDLITKVIEHNYVPRATCPNFMNFLLKIMGNDISEERARRLVDFLQTAFGYSLHGTPKEKIVAFCHGETDTGKTTLLTLLETLLNDYATTINVDSLMVKKSGNNELADISDLRGARFARSSETEQGQRINEARLKRLSQGAGKIKARRLYENFVRFDETHVLWIDCNHKPKVRGQDAAIWNRLPVIPFDVSIPKDQQDKQLGEKLLAEAEGILAWVVRGAVKYYAEGLQLPLEVLEASQNWKKEAEDLEEFVAACCELAPDAWVACGTLYSLYESWAEENGVEPLKANAFNERILGLGGKKKRKQIDGHYKRGFQGITIISSPGNNPESTSIPF